MRSKSMDLYNGFQTKNHNKFKSLYDLNDLGLHEDTHLVIIKLSKSWLLKFISRAIILALIILSFPWFNIAIGDLASSVNGSSTPLKIETLPLVFHDLANEGLIKSSDKALFIAINGNQESSINELQYINNMEVIHEIKLLDHQQQQKQKTLINPDDQMLFDFVFSYNYHATTSDFINKSLKVGGIVVIQLNENPSLSFQKPSNYKIVYLRRFDSTIIAMKRLADSDDDHHHTQQQQNSSATERKLLSTTTTTNAKKAALNKLEDVLLEPPRSSSGKSRKYLKHTRYLPDLMGDSLENYPRRVFIDVGLHDKNDDNSWFVKHYPTRNKDFEIYKIDTVAAESSDLKVVPQIGMSDWLAKNVKENEYVVMKAEAEVVEDMVKSKTIQLVDELFLECKHQGIKKARTKSKRAYWECLALYGILRDEGVAVHQWWG